MNRRRVLLALLFALMLAASGCARLLHHYDVTPSGLARADARLREALSDEAGNPRLAKLIADRNALPSDPLLARLYTGVLAYHAGEYATSAATFDSATLLIDERMTRSASRSALSLLSTDRVLPYQPGPTERLLLHYYAAHAWLRSGSVEGAAVEARRLARLLESTPAADAPQRALHGALRHFTAAIFALAGDHNDADVAYRNARLLAGDSAAGVRMPMPGPDSIDVFVFVDRGFVGHRAEQSIALWLGTDEVRGLRGHDHDRRLHIAQLVAARITAASDAGASASGTLLVDAAGVDTATEDGAQQATLTATGSANPTTPHASDEDDDDGTPYLMRIAWPVFRDVAGAFGRATLLVDSLAVAPFAHASVSAAVGRDFAAERGWIVARTVARAAAKLALTRGIEGELREKDETAADVFAILGNVTTAVTEQADTRSWTLLPAAIDVARVRVSATTLQVVVQAGGRSIPLDIEPAAGGFVVRHVALY
jgi:hypothetical protein